MFKGEGKWGEIEAIIRGREIRAHLWSSKGFLLVYYLGYSLLLKLQ